MYYTIQKRSVTIVKMSEQFSHGKTKGGSNITFNQKIEANLQKKSQDSASFLYRSSKEVR